MHDPDPGSRGSSVLLAPARDMHGPCGRPRTSEKGENAKSRILGAVTARGRPRSCSTTEAATALHPFVTRRRRSAAALRRLAITRSRFRASFGVRPAPVVASGRGCSDNCCRRPVGRSPVRVAVRVAIGFARRVGVAPPQTNAKIQRYVEEIEWLTLMNPGELLDQMASCGRYGCGGSVVGGPTAGKPREIRHKFLARHRI
jgi:hypothetical protein